MTDPRQAIIIDKTPTSRWDEGIDWAKPARQLGDDTIASSSWSVQGPDDALVLYDPVIPNGTTTIIWMQGGTLGNFYIVTNTIITVGGRTLTESFLVQVVAFVFLTPPHTI